MRPSLTQIFAAIRQNIGFTRTTEKQAPLDDIPLWIRIAEWALIFVAAWMYFGSYLSMPIEQFRLPGNEAPTVLSFGQILASSLSEGYFPLWNPYVSTGFPYSGDPGMYIYNPFISLPMLVFGYVKGFIFAVFFSILLGAYGMWWLARWSGLGSAGRVWTALMYIFAGVLTVRFIQGQYLLPISYGWLPLGVIALIRVLRFGGMRNIGISAMILAWLYLCGSLYYSYYMVFVGGLALLVFSIQIQPNRPRVLINYQPLINLLLTGTLVFGLVAIQLVPLIQFSPYINKAINLEFTDSHTLGQILLNYTSKDLYRPDAINILPPEEFYAYLGWWPFIGLLGLPFAFRKTKQTGLIVFTATLFIFTLLWMDIRDMPWREIYLRIPLLYQFRAPTRILVLGTLSLVHLSGVGLDAIWKYLLQYRQNKAATWQLIGANLLLLGLAFFMIASVADLYKTNGNLTGPTAYPTEPDQVLSDLRTMDPGTYYISAPPNWHEYTINYGMRYWDAWWAAGDRTDYTGMINRRGFMAAPKYRILPAETETPENTTRLPITGAYAVFQLEDSLPFAFTVPTETLMMSPDQTLQPAEVLEETAITKGPNQLALNVSTGETPTTLVTLVGYYPGWVVEIDGFPAKLLNVSGYMGVTAEPGFHRYTFTYRPPSFYYGLLLTLIALFIFAYLVSEGKILTLAQSAAKNWPASLRSRLRTPAPQATHEPVVLEAPAAQLFVTNTPPTPALVAPAPPGESLKETSMSTIQKIDVCSSSPLNSHQTVKITSPAGEPIDIEIGLKLPAATGVKFTIEAYEFDGQNPEQPQKVVNVSTGQTAGKPTLPQSNAAARSMAWKFPKLTMPAQVKALQPIWEKTKTYLGQRNLTLGTILFLLALGVYLFTRLYSLQYFPIYFFGDEAVQSIYAERLIENRFLDANGMGIPIYVEAAPNRWTPLIPMYFHAISILLFGKSLLVTRATSVFVTLLAVVSIGLSLKLVFKNKFWWAGVLVAAIIPAWFLHSRTAFETAMSTSFFGAFLFSYLLYRYHNPRFLYVALVFAALTFYSYSNAQLVMATAGLLLFVSDWKYHWQNRTTLLYGLALAVILASPIINFELKQPDGLTRHLEAVNSYWFQDLPVTEKLRIFASQYLYGLSPQYWVIPNNVDLPRHKMDSLGHIQLWTLPFILIGLVIALRKFKEPMYRAVVLAMLATPIGGAMLQASITRVLMFIIPASILTVLGIEAIFEWTKKYWQRFSEASIHVAVFVIFTAASLGLLRTALVEGPLWDRDYGLYGMQWGAKQIFVDTIPEYLQKDPTARFLVSSSWANGTDNFIQFFVPREDQGRVFMAGILTYMNNYTPIEPNDIFVLPTPEYQEAVASQKFDPIQVEKILYYPDGEPGFYFVRLAYASNVEEIFEAERLARLVPVVDTLQIGDQEVTVSHSRLDAGSLADAFDDDLGTLMRGQEANPFMLDFSFPEPRTLQGFQGDFSAFDYKITIELYAPGSDTPVTYVAEEQNVNIDFHVDIAFDKGPEKVARVKILVHNLLLPLDSANIHIRGLKFLP